MSEAARRLSYWAQAARLSTEGVDAAFCDACARAWAGSIIAQGC